ncbi:lytic transglycosylase domain-containing protein [Bacillus sp. FJAT-29937]|uniref:lytic transglycosylase domain-containing protein n=1 Tax=Bacillus sp. FJAT-29937 TaxID=1720553 RepID=UPI00082DEEC5|nr:lytic transglycosylase domain-containing protein [Bacillus sp. FJAT-29937]
MNVEQLKIMLDLQALKNFNSSQAPSENSQLFQDLLNQLLQETNLPDSTANEIQFEKFASQTESNPQAVINGQSLPPFMLTKLSGSGTETAFDEIIEKASELYRIPAKLLRSVIKQESNYNQYAISHSGASGLMQLMPETAKSLGVKNVFDPQENVFGGAKYLRQMLNKYDENIELALAAYNAGPGNVDKHGGIPPFKETMNYVRKIKSAFLS